jgi:hypothetical protein
LVDFRKLEWLFPETIANFDKLLIQYRGFCGYTFATTDGLLLPGIVLEIVLFPLPNFFSMQSAHCDSLVDFLKCYGIRW